MKKVRIFFLCGLVAAFTACEASKEATTSTTTKTSETSAGRNVSETTGYKQSPSADRRNEAAAVNARSKEREVQRNQAMYRATNMTPEQISHYEKEWRTLTSNRGRSNTEGNEYEHVEQQDKIMEKILDQNQFERYQQWVRTQAKNRD